MSALSSIALIDNQSIFRKGMKSFLTPNTGFQVVADFDQLDDLTASYDSVSPDLVLVDADFSRVDVQSVFTSMKQAWQAAKIVIVTSINDSSAVLSAIKSGVDGYLLKDIEPAQLLQKLKSVMAGDVVIADQISNTLVGALRQDDEPESRQVEQLTRRENQILALIAEGMSNKGIANELNITYGTVKVHVRHLLRKLNLSTRTEAAVWMLQSGVIVGNNMSR